MPDPIVVLEAAEVRFGRTLVLTDVDLTVDAGQTVGVAGPNGVGKTTLLGVVATLVPLSSGTGQVLGARLGTPDAADIRPRIGWSGHEPALYDHLTLRENLHLVSRLGGGADPAVVDDALDRVGLIGAADRRADRCSNGMRRRIDLAVLLMRDPDLVLLDEAHAGLDAHADAIVGAIVRRATGRGGAAILVSHDPGRLQRETDSLITLEAS